MTGSSMQRAHTGRSSIDWSLAFWPSSVPAELAGRLPLWECHRLVTQVSQAARPHGTWFSPQCRRSFCEVSGATGVAHCSQEAR